MIDLFFKILPSFILFGRNMFGCLNSPYITMRKLAEEKTDSRQVIFIWFLVVFYFAFASLVRAGISQPFLLTLKFNLLLFGGFVGFSLMIFSLYFLGRLLGGQGSLRSVVVLWSYTLLPTILWFFLTSFSYLLLPPPRTLSFFGKLFSLWFIFYSIALFFWKLILYYLTLRFGLRLDLLRISMISTILIPLLFGYSILMYKFGIFRVPFL